MSFPQPISLPDEVYKARKARGQALIRVALWGIAVRLFIVVFELTGYFCFHSAALLVDAISTALDVCSSIFLVIFVKLAERPPDEDHPFGHGRYEPLAGMQLGILLACAGIYMLFQQMARAWATESLVPVGKFAWVFPLASVVLLEFSYRKMMAIASREQSPALAAEAAHFRVDGLNSLLALIALLLAAYFPQMSILFDSLGAIAIAIFMIGMGAYATKSNVQQIMDRIPEERFFILIRDAAKSVSGVLGTEKVRIQLSGPSAHVDIDVEVDPALSVEKAHTISQHVRTAIQRAWPQVQDATVHIEPYYADDHG